jgi:hypothetical protein
MQSFSLTWFLEDDASAPKMSSELWTMVRNDSARDPMEPDYLIEVQLSIVCRTLVYSDGNEVSRLG